VKTPRACSPPRKNTYDPAAPEVCDTLRITRRASERLFRAAFREAERRRGQVTLVDKSNVLPSMAYFRGIFDEIAAGFQTSAPSASTSTQRPSTW
jgi:3-isopropylmalate dehydrogenase